MNHRLMALAVICMPLFLFSQTETIDKGIRFVQNLSWQQVQQKAKQENKYIFVDCYATWCKPCKQMEKDVYTVDSVGDFLNAGFISVKLQMDVTDNDDADVKSWYKTARYIESQYDISGYPSFVFFAPDGEVVSKETGYRAAGSFIQVARNAKDPSKQYYVLLKKYREGKLDNASTVSLIKMTQQLGDTADYRQLLSGYYSYLHKQPKEKLYTKENIEFVASTIDRSSMVLFDMFYPNGKEVNKVMQSDWYSKNVVDQIILKEKVGPLLGLKDLGEMCTYGSIAPEISEPDWDVLYKSIAKDYKGDYAGRNVLYAKEAWYSSHGDFLNEARCFNDGMEKYGTDTTDLGEDFKLNQKAWYLFFLQVTDQKQLELASDWMAGVARRSEKATGDYAGYRHAYLDTYAQLLYKAGRTEEAMKWEGFALATMKETVKDEETVKAYSAGYMETLDKMKQGEPTWPIATK